jgi:NADH:ubiquinone oxidoreductase subunit 5 (subunit L)/multisubunit Na+/H+ antiporter MnhA subunit
MFLLGSLAISGLPLFSGFISEFAIYLGMANGFAFNNLAFNISLIICFSGLALIGMMAVLCFTKVFGICFLGSPRSKYDENLSNESSLFLIPMIILSVLILLIGLLPSLVMPFLYHIVKQFVNTDISAEFESIIQIYKWFGYVYLIFIGLFSFFFLLRSLLLRNRKVSEFKTWDCGYQAGSSRMQYTSSSFAQPFLQLVGELVPQKIKVKKEHMLFPIDASLISHTQDNSERFLIQPVIRILDRFLNKFTWIQSGKTQEYIAYGLIFLIFLIIWILGAEL